MNSKSLTHGILLLSLASLLLVAGCGDTHAPKDVASAGAPPPAKIVSGADVSLFTVEHPEQFPLAIATQHLTASELVVTGAVAPDVSRNVPVVSLASGRVVAVNTRLGDPVKKGQLLMTIRSDDVAGGYASYRIAVSDEILARAQLERAKDLYEHGATALNDFQIAKDTEDKAKVTSETAAEHLRLLGNDPEKPQSMVDIFAPTSGINSDQQVTVGSLVQAYSAPYPFTIADLSKVWVVCDVYENDLAAVHIGDTADITLTAYPGRTFKGRVSNILPTLDPNLRTAKVRIEVANPGNMRLGMFVKATFRGQTTEMHTIVQASAVLRMHDRDFVYVPAPNRQFRRVEVISGDLLQDNTTMQEIKSGLAPGQKVVSNALILDHVLAQ